MTRSGRRLSRGNNPGGFYDVHTAEYPNGAIRGRIVDVEKDGV